MAFRMKAITKSIYIIYNRAWAHMGWYDWREMRWVEKNYMTRRAGKGGLFALHGLHPYCSLGCLIHLTRAKIFCRVLQITCYWFFLILDKYAFRIWCNACPVTQYKGVVDILIDWKNYWTSLLAECVSCCYLLFSLFLEEKPGWSLNSPFTNFYLRWIQIHLKFWEKLPSEWRHFFTLSSYGITPPLDCRSWMENTYLKKSRHTPGKPNHLGVTKETCPTCKGGIRGEDRELKEKIKYP